MAKNTRRIKNHKKNRTIKKGGGGDDDRKGLFDIIGNKIYNTGSSIINSAYDKALHVAGLERINKMEENKDTTSTFLNENIEKIGNTTSNIVSNIDKTGASIIGNVNNLLESDTIQNTTIEAAKNTAEIIKKGAEEFNTALNNPVVKEEVLKAIDNASEIANVGVEAMKEPLNKAIDNTSESLQRAMPKLGSALTKTAWDMAGTLPPLNIPIEGLNVLNDITKAASAATEAATEAIETGSDLLIETKENIGRALKDLNEKKQMSEQISKRTTESINQFENPIQSQFGGKRTRKKFLNRRIKSKRVRFAI
jgi:ABC-type transporter Mla subunit MlaD